MMNDQRLRQIILGAVAGLAGLVAMTAFAGEPNTRGAELLAPFKQGLMQALKAGLAEGPEQAVAACQLQAPAIAAAQSTGGVRVGRTSHRLRNPANASPDWVRPILDAYLGQSGGWEPQTVSLPGGREGYVEPIVMKSLCTQCHGQNLDAAVAARISELYPNDRATGFEVGDLRGVFLVEYPMEGVEAR